MLCILCFWVCMGSDLSLVSILGNMVFGATGGGGLWERKSVYHQRQPESRLIPARRSNDDGLKHVEFM